MTEKWTEWILYKCLFSIPNNSIWNFAYPTPTITPSAVMKHIWCEELIHIIADRNEWDELEPDPVISKEHIRVVLACAHFFTAVGLETQEDNLLFRKEWGYQVPVPFAKKQQSHNEDDGPTDFDVFASLERTDLIRSVAAISHNPRWKVFTSSMDIISLTQSISNTADTWYFPNKDENEMKMKSVTMKTTTYTSNQITPKTRTQKTN